MYVCIFDCTGSSLLCEGFLQLQCGLLFIAVHRLLLLLTHVLGHVASVLVAHRLSFSEVCRILLKPGIEPMSPALAGRFLTTRPPGKPQSLVFMADNRKDPPGSTH